MFKTCPSCGDEFVAHVEQCPDCRVPLRAPGETPPASAPAEHALADAVLLRAGETRDLRELAERLDAAGIACAIDTDPPGASVAAAGAGARRGGGAVRLALYVAARDAHTAARVHQAWVAEIVPDSGSANDMGLIDACPGCGEPLAPTSAACASCGLEFPELQVACPECGQGVEPEAERCGHCGYRP
jgi:hypothetical protein